MENTGGSPKNREKKGLFMKTIERWRSFGTDRSREMENRSKSYSSSTRPGFWNRSKSTSNSSFHGSTKKTEKRNLFTTKTLQRSRSLSSWPSDMKTQPKLNPTSPVPSFLCRSKSTSRASSNQVVPAGCFTVYVGPKKERFVVKTMCLNHPLFHALLQQAEHEFGFATDGPIILPCDVELFREVMLEMEQQSSPVKSPRCNFSKSPYRYGLISPSTLVVAGPI